MSDTPETKFKKAAANLFKSYGRDLWWFKVLGGESQKAGVPDIVGCYKGKFFAPELKVAPNKPSEKQLYEIEKIQSAGGASGVIWDIDQLKEFMCRLEG